MKTSSRKTVIVVTAALALAAARVGLPALLTWLANLAVRKIPGIRGKVRRVQINFMTPGLTAKDVSLTTLNGGAPEHLIQVEGIAVNSEWKAFLTGALVGSLRIDAPRLLFNPADGIRRGNRGKGKPEQQPEIVGRPWQEKVMQLPRFKLSWAVLTDGEIRAAGLPGEKGAEVSIDRLNLRAENINQETDAEEHSEEQGILLNDLFHVARFLRPPDGVEGALQFREDAAGAGDQGNDSDDSGYNAFGGPIGGGLKHVPNRRRAFRTHQSADFLDDLSLCGVVPEHQPGDGGAMEKAV